MHRVSFARNVTEMASSSFSRTQGHVQAEAFREACTAEADRILPYFKRVSASAISNGVELVVAAASARSLPQTWLDLKAIEPQFTGQYRELTSITELGDANFTGFRKIVKKYRKKTGRDDMDALFSNVSAALGDLGRIERLQAEIEEAFADIFCNKDAKQAQKMLRPMTRRPSMFERFTANVVKFSGPDFLAAATSGSGGAHAGAGAFGGES